MAALANFLIVGLTGMTSVIGGPNEVSVPVPVAYPVRSAAASPSPGKVSDRPPSGALHLDQLIIQRRTIIRLPMLPRPAPRERDAVNERHALASRNGSGDDNPRCIPVDELNGASFSPRSGVAFATGNGKRYRAILERGCRALYFQSGFYLEPAADGAICAGRDMLRARSGAACMVTAFRRLP